MASPTGEAPGILRRLLRFSQLAGTNRKGKTAEILDLLLKDMKDSGIPQTAIERMEQMGDKLLKFKGSKGVPKSISALAGSAENSKLIEASLSAARAAHEGFKPTDLKGAFDSLLNGLRESGESEDLIAQIRKIGPDRLSKVGAVQATSALARRGKDPFVTTLFNKVIKKAPTPQVGQALTDALKQVGEGAIPKVAAGTEAALAEAGVAGGSTLAKLGRGAARTLGEGPVGFGLSTVLPAFMIGKSLYNSSGKTARAKEMAIKGFQQLGGNSSANVMAELVKQQEMAARRKIVLQSFEPDMFHQTLNALADTGQGQPSLTDTERRIGANQEQALPTRRSDTDIKFLLDQLVSETSGPY